MKNKPKHSSKKNAKLNPDITPMSCLYLKGKERLKKTKYKTKSFTKWRERLNIHCREVFDIDRS